MYSANSCHPLPAGFPNLTLYQEAFCEGSRAPDLPTLNPRSFISAMNHPSLLLLCYCFQIPWQHICKPGSGPLRSFLPATHSLFLLSRVPTSPDKTHSLRPAYFASIYCRANDYFFHLVFQLIVCGQPYHHTEMKTSLLCASCCSTYFT